MGEEKKAFFKRLVSGLTKTRDNIVSGMDSIFHGFSKIDDDFYEELEETLIMGDLGALKAKGIQADLALGSLYADELQTGQLDATLALGSAELGTVQAERVTIENAQGDVTISRLVGASQVQVTDQLGNIALTLGEKADGYSVQAACGLGSITVSGAKQASPYSTNSKAANAVILDAALGDITLNFEE